MAKTVNLPDHDGQLAANPAAASTAPLDVGASGSPAAGLADSGSVTSRPAAEDVSAAAQEGKDAAADELDPEAAGEDELDPDAPDEDERAEAANFEAASKDMWRRDRKIDAGLWLVATPIGTARDITLRALDVLAGADVLAAEDTRSLRRLLDIHGIPLAGRHILTYHDHSDSRDREKILRELREGRSVVYASEAGTPLIADPGYQLVQTCAKEGLNVTSAPGVSAVVTALSLAGLPTDRFLFAGFAPSRSAERKRWLTELAATPATLVIYESPRRVREMLADAVQCLGDRQAAVCRELTKKFEDVRRGTLSSIAASMDRDPRGEIVVVIDRSRDDAARGMSMEDELRKALQTMRVRDAADAVAAALSLPRRDVYQAALRLAQEQG